MVLRAGVMGVVVVKVAVMPSSRVLPRSDGPQTHLS
jgi:hypothetical protein